MESSRTISLNSRTCAPALPHTRVRGLGREERQADRSPRSSSGARPSAGSDRDKSCSLNSWIGISSTAVMPRAFRSQNLLDQAAIGAREPDAEQWDRWYSRARGARRGLSMSGQAERLVALPVEVIVGDDAFRCRLPHRRVPRTTGLAAPTTDRSRGGAKIASLEARRLPWHRDPPRACQD